MTTTLRLSGVCALLVLLSACSGTTDSGAGDNGGGDPAGANGDPSGSAGGDDGTDPGTPGDDAGAGDDANATADGDASTQGDAGFQAAYPGQAPPGEVLWGAAVSGNGDPVVRHETPAGHPLTVHRTFYQWSQRKTSMITAAKDDVAHHRVPWVSIKPPSWAEMAAGTHDAEIDEMLTALKGVSGSVWLTIHHEPEGGGGVNAPDDPAGPSGHIAMNEHVRARMTALNLHNVALAPILMSYTWTKASKRDPNAWWKAGIYDFLGVDHYRDAEATLLDATWADIRTWAEAKGVDIAVGEWGMRGTDAAAGARVHDWYDAAISSATDGQGARVVGLSAFDSNLNSPSGGWELTGEQLTAFQALLGDARTANVEP